MAAKIISRMPKRKTIIFITATACLYLDIFVRSTHLSMHIRQPLDEQVALGPTLHNIRESSTPTSLHTKKSNNAWTSPHLVDCREMAAALEQEPEDGMFKQTLTTPSFLMNIYNPEIDAVSKRIFDEGCWECNHLKDMLSALSHYHDSYFLDIGGNIGMWSLTAAAANHQTFTIEALSDNCKRFCKTVDKNAFHNQTHLMNIAATSDSNHFRLNVPTGNKGGTRVVAVGNRTNEDGVVKGVPIDQLNLPVDRPVVMKVDVEGHELQALLGAKQFLKNANIVYAMMELRPNLHRNNQWKGIFDVFVSKGLRPIRLNYEDETELDVNRLHEWKHFKHPAVKYYDVAWRLDDFVPGDEN